MGNICWLGMGGGGTGTGSWIVLFLKFVHILCLFTQKPRVHLPTSPPSEGPWAQCNGKGSRFRTELWGSLGRGQTSGWVTEHAVYALWFHGFHKDACPQMHFPAHLKGRKIAPLEFSSVIQGFIICRVTLFYQSLAISLLQRIILTQGLNPGLCIAGGFFPSWAIREALFVFLYGYKTI